MDQPILQTQTGVSPAVDEVTVTSLTLRTADGVSLGATVYDSNNPATMTLLMLPGIGVPQRAFRHLASWLAIRGARCVTVDYRGMGASVSPEGVVTATLSTWAREDAVAAFEYAETTWPEPVALIGHSFGGQAVGLAKTLHRSRAAVFICSQFGSARHWPGMARWSLAAYWHVWLPVLCRFFEVLPAWSGPAGPLPRGVASEWARWGRQHDWYASCERDAVRLLSEFAAPTLAYGVSDDPIAPPRAVSTFLDRFFAVDPERRKLEPEQFGVKAIGHVGLLRPAVGTAGVWQEILEFLNDNVGTESIR